MASGDCLPKSEQVEREEKNFIELAREFSAIPEVAQLGRAQIGMWNSLIQNVTKGKLSESGVPNTEQLKLIKRKLTREVKKLAKVRGGLAKSLYLSEELYNDIPFTKDWYEAVANSAEKYKGHTSFFNTQLTNIFRLLKDASFKEGSKSILDAYTPGARPKAQKRLQNMYKEYSKLQRKGDVNGAIDYFHNNIDPFLQKGEGQVFRMFHELVTATDSQFTDYMNKGTYERYGQIVEAANIWRAKNGIHSRAKELMVQGLKQYRSSLQGAEHLLGNFTKYKPTLETINHIIKRYESGELQKEGYFPVLSLDVMPSLAEASRHLFYPQTKGRGESDFNTGADIIQSLRKTLDDNIYMNRNLKDGGESSKKISFNVIPLMDSYVRSASRFNFVAYNTGKYIDVMKDIYDTRNNGTALNAKLDALQGMISDTYGMVVGDYNQSGQTLNNFTRAITAWQFASKLGLNIRGATRNATQSLLNWVWFGKEGMGDTRRAMKDANMKSRVDSGLADNGILFPEIREIYFEDLAPKVDYNKNSGTYQERLDLSWGDKITENIQRVAEKVGKPMTWVENRINRRYTFQLGYNMAWQSDSAKLPALRRQFDRRLERALKKEGTTIEKLKETEATIFKQGDSNQYEFEFEQYRRKRAVREANAAVRNLHFDYSITAKSKILTSRAGAVLGQFQHYGINFFNLQRKIVRDGVDDVMVSQWGGDSAWRMYRLGLLYTTMYGIFSPLMNADIGNLVQNDTLERLKSYHDAVLSDDDEVRKKAFFGKGPVLGTIGGPFIADLTTIGNISGLYEMDEDGWGAYLSGYQDLADESGNEKLRTLVRTLNTQVHRGIYSTYPKWRNGAQFGTLLQSELGLFPTSEVRQRREKLGLGTPPKAKKRKAPPTPDEAILHSLKLLQD